MSDEKKVKKFVFNEKSEPKKAETRPPTDEVEKVSVPADGIPLGDVIAEEKKALEREEVILPEPGPVVAPVLDDPDGYVQTPSGTEGRGREGRDGETAGPQHQRRRLQDPRHVWYGSEWEIHHTQHPAQGRGRGMGVVQKICPGCQGGRVPPDGVRHNPHRRQASFSKVSVVELR